MPSSEVLQRLLVAAVLSGLVGYERERRGRAAGLRTHMLVGLGSALMMLTGIHLFEVFAGHAELDPTRIGAQVVSGIGFLGAGTIFRAKATIKGLTTAATLWLVAGIGLAAGSGFYAGAVVTTGLALVALFALTRLEPRHRQGSHGGDGDGNGTGGD